MRSRVLERCLCSAFSACVPYSWKGRTDFALCHSLVLSFSFSFSFLCRKWFTLLNSHDQNARVLRAKEKQRPLVHSLAVVHVEVFVRSSSRSRACHGPFRSWLSQTKFVLQTSFFFSLTICWLGKNHVHQKTVGFVLLLWQDIIWIPEW
jgi:hypothetical protein